MASRCLFFPSVKRAVSLSSPSCFISTRVLVRPAWMAVSMR